MFRKPPSLPGVFSAKETNLQMIYKIYCFDNNSSSQTTQQSVRIYLRKPHHLIEDLQTTNSLFINIDYHIFIPLLDIKNIPPFYCFIVIDRIKIL